MKVKNSAAWIAGLWLLFAPVITLRAAEADVIVYGATPGGFCAAIAAAREGASVILLEPTDHVGGLSTGGLSHCDSNQMRRETLLGLFDEWHRRVVKDYTDPPVMTSARVEIACLSASRWLGASSLPVLP